MRFAANVTSKLIPKIHRTDELNFASVCRMRNIKPGKERSNEETYIPAHMLTWLRICNRGEESTWRVAMIVTIRPHTSVILDFVECKSFREVWSTAYYLYVGMDILS